MMCTAAADDDVQWKAEALDNPILAAAELYFLARPSERAAWRCRHPGDGRLLPERWGRRGLRTKAAAVEKGEEEAWSPNTPLSWSVSGSASSSSGGEKLRKVVGTGGVAPPPGGSVIKATTQVMEDPVAVGSTVAAKRRQGKRKMTLAELRDCERLLLDTTKELQKEVEEQRTAHRLLLEENERLRNSRTELYRRSVQGSNQAYAVAEANVKKQICLPFDLNMSLLEEFDDAAY